MLSKPCTLEECARVLRKWLPAAAQKVAHAPARPGEDSAPAGRSDGPVRLAAASCVDSSAVARLRGLRGGGQAGLYAKLVDLFHTGSSDSLLQLQAAFQTKDFKAGAALCHKLASSAANVGALAYAQEVRQLEQLCLAGDAAAVQPVFDLLRTAHPRLIDELLELKLRATA
jgi:HPt (histidine-containing phosphotransfer) domain-containing protein